MTLKLAISIIIIVIIVLIIKHIITNEDYHDMSLLKRLIYSLIIISLVICLFAVLISKKEEPKKLKEPIVKEEIKEELDDSSKYESLPEEETVTPQPEVKQQETIQQPEIKKEEAPVVKETPKQEQKPVVKSSVVSEPVQKEVQKEQEPTRSPIAKYIIEEEATTEKTPVVVPETKPVTGEVKVYEPPKEEKVVETPKEQTKPVETPKPVVTPQPEPKPVVTPTPKPKETPKKEVKKTNSKSNNMIYFLGVGASADSFIIRDNGKIGIIDTALDKNATVIRKQLNKLKVKEIDFILITHSHRDHTNGYEKIMNTYKVKKVYLKKDGAKDPKHKKIYKKLINIASKKNASICDVKNKNCQNITLGNTKIKLYNTTYMSTKPIAIIHKDRFDNANSIAAVATINGKKIYFSGDIGNYFGCNRETITAKEIGKVHVYKAAHHGYITFNNKQEALNNLKPEYAVVTNDSVRSAIAVRRIKKSNKNYRKTYYTVRGTVTLNVDYQGKLVFKQ